MSERKRVASPWWPEVETAEPYDGRSYGAGVSFGREQALQEIRDRGDVIVSREVAERLLNYASHMNGDLRLWAERDFATLNDLLAVSDV